MKHDAAAFAACLDSLRERCNDIPVIHELGSVMRDPEAPEEPLVALRRTAVRDLLQLRKKALRLVALAAAGERLYRVVTQRDESYDEDEELQALDAYETAAREMTDDHDRRSIPHLQ